MNQKLTILTLALALAITSNCKKEEKNDDDATLLLLFLSQQKSGISCDSTSTNSTCQDDYVLASGQSFAGCATSATRGTGCSSTNRVGRCKITTSPSTGITSYTVNFYSAGGGTTYTVATAQTTCAAIKGGTFTAN